MAFLLLIVVGLLAFLRRPRPPAAPAVAVQVLGEVEAPGWYELSPATVHAAVRAAGGDPDGLPEAGLSAGTRLVVGGGGVRLERAERPLILALPVDLNTAAAAELEAIPGVGPALAAAIVDERRRGGPYESVGALRRVRGVGEATLEALRPFVAAGDR